MAKFRHNCSSHLVGPVIITRKKIKNKKKSCKWLLSHIMPVASLQSCIVCLTKKQKRHCKKHHEWVSTTPWRSDLFLESFCWKPLRFLTFTFPSSGSYPITNQQKRVRTGNKHDLKQILPVQQCACSRQRVNWMRSCELRDPCPHCRFESWEWSPMGQRHRVQKGESTRWKKMQNGGEAEKLKVVFKKFIVNTECCRKQQVYQRSLHGLQYQMFCSQGDQTNKLAGYVNRV